MRVLPRLAACAAVGVLLSAFLAATAHASSAGQISRMSVPTGGFQFAPSRHAMWAVRADDLNSALVLRIAPATDQITRVANLHFAAGGFAVGYGSLWISDYYGNAVWRVSPRGAVQQRIRVGLQPEAVHIAFGSVWVANHHGQSLSRIDPRTDKVIATDSAGDPNEFRSGPQGMTAGPRRLFVGSSNLLALQAVNPATNVTTTPPATADTFCGPLNWLAGYVWSPDECTNTVYKFTTAGAIRWSHRYGPTSGSDVPQVLGSALRGDELWIVIDRHFDEDTGTGRGATVKRLDPSTGAVLERVPIGGDATTGVFAGFGSLWVSDSTHSRLTRVTPGNSSA